MMPWRADQASAEVPRLIDGQPALDAAITPRAGSNPTELVATAELESRRSAEVV
jgi:hypothetical protein